MTESLDKTDIAILRILQENARITVKDLALKVHLSPTPVFERMRRLESGGYIQRYTAVLSPARLGRGFTVFCPAGLRQHEIPKWFEKMYAPIDFTASPIEPGLNEINIVVHCVNSLLNPSRVDGRAKWLFYREGLSPAIVRFIEAVDAERVELERALGLTPRRLTDMLWQFYGDQGMATPEEGLYTQLSTFGSFATVPGPLSWEHRFISEDLRCGIVPMYHLGEQAGVPMPATRAAIELASRITGRDELAIGRRVQAV